MFKFIGSKMKPPWSILKYKSYYLTYKELMKILFVSLFGKYRVILTNYAVDWSLDYNATNVNISKYMSSHFII